MPSLNGEDITWKAVRLPDELLDEELEEDELLLEDELLEDERPDVELLEDALLEDELLEEDFPDDELPLEPEEELSALQPTKVAANKPTLRDKRVFCIEFPPSCELQKSNFDDWICLLFFIGPSRCWRLC